MSNYTFIDMFSIRVTGFDDPIFLSLFWGKQLGADKVFPRTDFTTNDLFSLYMDAVKSQGVLATVGTKIYSFGIDVVHVEFKPETLVVSSLTSNRYQVIPQALLRAFCSLYGYVYDVEQEGKHIFCKAAA